MNSKYFCQHLSPCNWVTDGNDTLKVVEIDLCLTDLCFELYESLIKHSVFVCASLAKECNAFEYWLRIVCACEECLAFHALHKACIVIAKLFHNFSLYHYVFSLVMMLIETSWTATEGWRAAVRTTRSRITFNAARRDSAEVKWTDGGSKGRQ